MQPEGRAIQACAALGKEVLAETVNEIIMYARIGPCEYITEY